MRFPHPLCPQYTAVSLHHLLLIARSAPVRLTAVFSTTARTFVGRFSAPTTSRAYWETKGSGIIQQSVAHFPARFFQRGGVRQVAEGLHVQRAVFCLLPRGVYEAGSVYLATRRQPVGSRGHHSARSLPYLIFFSQRTFRAARSITALMIARRTGARELLLVVTKGGHTCRFRGSERSHSLHPHWLSISCRRYKEFGVVDECYPKNGHPPCTDFFDEVGLSRAELRVSFC
jgi:hypothetical protein